jgi:thiamine biosynthesis protein ThiS
MTHFLPKTSQPRISVELKIIGFFYGEYINILDKVTIDQGCSPSDLLRASRKSGLVSPDLYKHLRNIKKYVIQCNGEVIPTENVSKTSLVDGDSILIFSFVAGG